ncbi:outer membrane beta-barrel protein [Rhodopseudomonas palustris]|uniref:Outer membrane beta-barrel protein n=1 Tax=Rhodopseudomonas palustris (strain BisB18) TaxID=316056 RepID=Q21B97_RHOPB
MVILGPASGRRKRAEGLCAVSACLLLALLGATDAAAQSLTPELLSPEPGGFVAPQDLPLRRTAQARPDLNALPDAEPMAPSRIGKIPSYGIPAAAGASDSGYDSLNRRRRAPRFYPGAPRPKRAGPGSPAVIAPPPPRRVAPPSASAHRTPLAPSMAGTVIGQPPRRQLKVDNDPFGAVGDYAGSFLVKSAVETSGGYDSNPGRVSGGSKGSSFYVVAPELMVTSDWERHALVADLRGSYTGYGSTRPDDAGSASSAPANLDRPSFDGHVDGRLDVSRDTRLLGQLRMRLFTDNPGSPNLDFGLAKYPLALNTGASAGFDQNFNRLQVSGVGTLDRTTYQQSVLTDGSTEPNNDRNFNQYGGVARVSYELMPGLKPFGEVEYDSRVHDQAVDRGGYQRDSTGGYVKAGTSFEFTRLLTGEMSIGYTARSYTDPRLEKLTGLLTSGSLIWAATPLTTAKFITNTSVDESTLPGVSGVLTRSYTAEVDHDFRRWLTAIGKFTYGSQDYQGSSRLDHFGAVAGNLVYKLNRSFQLKAELRREWLDSNLPGNSYSANVVMLGVRLQN